MRPAPAENIRACASEDACRGEKSRQSCQHRKNSDHMSYKKDVNRRKNIVKNVVSTLTRMENCGSIVSEK